MLAGGALPVHMSVPCAPSPHRLTCPMRRAKGRVLGFLWSEIQKGQDSPLLKDLDRPRLELSHGLRQMSEAQGPHL